MIDKFFAIGYHGTTKENSQRILKGINFELNVGDKFLGQGFYLWRDSYERAVSWKGLNGTLEKIDKSVISVRIENDKKKTLNFTSYNWNNEKDLLRLFNDEFSDKLYFGEFIDLLIKSGLAINLVIIADLRNNPAIIEIDTVKFAYTDIQMCLKDDLCIKDIEEVKI